MMKAALRRWPAIPILCAAFIALIDRGASWAHPLLAQHVHEHCVYRKPKP